MIEFGRMFLSHLLRVYSILRFVLCLRSLVTFLVSLEDRMTHNSYPVHGTVGINEFLDVVDVGLLTINGYLLSLKNDGKINSDDYVNFLPPLLQIPDALTDVSLIPSELKDFQPEELEICKNHILSKIPGLGEKWKVVLIASFKIGAGIYEIFDVMTTKK